MSLRSDPTTSKEAVVKLSRGVVLSLSAVTLVGGFLVTPVAQASAAEQVPVTLPALNQWTTAPGSYTFGSQSQVVVDKTDTALTGDATTFASDLADEMGRTVSVTSRQPASGDVVLSVDPSRSDLGDEGYAMTVDDTISITGRTSTGAFYGTRTVLQLLKQSASIPAGSTIDVPKYRERGLGIAMITAQLTPEFLERTVKDLAYLKMNQLHLELKVKSVAHPEVNSWAYLTKAQAGALAAIGQKYHVDIIVEVNDPGHMEFYLHNHPELVLKNADGSPVKTSYGSYGGDISNPALLPFVTSLAKEQMSAFPGKYWHTGSDEYNYGDGVVLTNAAREQLGPNATARDLFFRYVRDLDAKITELGRRPRMWNDGIHGAAEAAQVPASTVVEYWLGSSGIATPQQLADTGHDILNVSYDTYMIRPFSDTTSKAAGLYARKWDPTQFHGGYVLTGSHLLGAKVTVWQDNITGDTERDVEANMTPMVRFMAQVTWGAPNPDADYAAFAARADAVGRAPGYVNEDLQPVKSGRYTLRTTAGTLGAGDATSGVPVGNGSAAWTVTVNNRGYYSMQSAGKCLSVTSDATAVVTIGLPLVLETCSGSPGQQFRLTTVNQGSGFTINPASSQMLLTVENGVAVQRPADQVKSNATWQLSGAAS